MPRKSKRRFFHKGGVENSGKKNRTCDQTNVTR